MGVLWVLLLVALTGSQLGRGLPVRSTPPAYPHESSGPSLYETWGGGAYAAVPALALVLTAVGLLLGCTWCYRHKDCKLFTASATHIHDARRSNPPDSGFSEPANNNISEDNNNGPISLREMQNIANNNAAAYIVSENEERNRVSRESVVEFEPLPANIRVVDPLEHCADWFGGEDFPRNRLQYLREIGRGWFGRVVEGEIEEDGTSTVAVKILNQNASLEDKARFLDEARLYRDASHPHVLRLLGRCLAHDPWILLFELCPMDLHQYLVTNRPKMAMLNESGVPLQLMCDVTSALAYLHSRGYLYGNVCAANVLVRDPVEGPRAALGCYAHAPAQHDFTAPETRTRPPVHTTASEVWSLGTLIWEVCTWGAPVSHHPPPPELPCVYRNHLYQVMQLCWAGSAAARPSAAQVLALMEHLRRAPGGGDFERRWQSLKPNTIPKLDEHVALVHAPSGSEREPRGSRPSSAMSDKEPLSAPKSESLTNLHGSLEDVRNIYLTHNEAAALECHQGNVALDLDRSDAAVDPWLKDIIAGSQDDVSYYRDVSDVIKNLDNILNSEKTSSSESSHQASPSRDNLSLDCKKEYPVQSSMVKSPGISNFQNILGVAFDEESKGEVGEEEEDRDTIGTLSHSFERHSDSTSQQTLENLTPETPVRDLDIECKNENQTNADITYDLSSDASENVDERNIEMPNIENSDILSKEELCVAKPSVSQSEQIVRDCENPCDSNLTETLRTESEVETKSIVDRTFVNDEQASYEETAVVDVQEKAANTRENEEPNIHDIQHISSLDNILPKTVSETENKVQNDMPVLGGNIPVVQEFTIDTEEKKPEENLSEREDVLTNTPVSFVNEAIQLITPDTIPEINQDINITDLDNRTEIENQDIKKDSIQELKVEPLENTLVISPITMAPEQVQIFIDIERASSLRSENQKSESRNTVEPTTVLPPLVQSIDDGSISDIIVTENVIETSENAVKPEEEQQDSKSEIAYLDIGNTAHDIKEELMKQETTPDESIKSDLSIEKGVPVPKLDNVISDTPDALNGMVVLSNNDVSDDKPLFMNSTSSIENLKLVTHVEQNVENNEANSCLIVKQEGNNEDLKETKDSQPALPDSSIDYSCTEGDISSVDLEVSNLEDTAVKKVIESTEEVLTKDENISKLHTDATGNKDVLENSEEAANAVDVDLPSYAEAMQQLETFKSKKIHNASKTKPSNIPTNFKELPEDSPIDNSCENDSVRHNEILEDARNMAERNENVDRSDNDLTNGDKVKEESNNSTVYLDLISDTTNNEVSKRETSKHDTLDENVKDVIQTCLEGSSDGSSCTLVKNESTQYLDLPSLIKETNDFLQFEKVANHDVAVAIMSASTPKGTNSSAENTLEGSLKEIEPMSYTKVFESQGEITKLEQRHESLSPFDSPTKSHPTDTYDENSSVVLGPFENCATEACKGVKDLVDIPKEELLAFSSNFSEINLETPSPLRDGNFLNEVPDIVHEDLLDTSTSESKRDVSKSEPHSDNSDETDNSGTAKRVSPLTPPNSPGIFLASTSQQKYLVDIDLNPEPLPPVDLSDSLKEVDLNQIELQITSKLAMAENENNMNIEYSGPLTVVGLVLEDSAVLRESDAIPESYLAGNGGSVEDLRDGFSLDEDCMRALRNELELKLPLAQVAAIEPAAEGGAEWSELPPPPELVVNYCALGGALSPIAEETRHQLSAYENDAWNASIRTESSESYPEPCNNSTDEVTELPTAAPSGGEHSTYTIHSRPHSGNDTYTVQKDITISKEITMSADSLNGSPFRKPVEVAQSPLDRTYVKDDFEKDSCERISQVSPFVLSPTTDTSIPTNSDNFDNATGVSTLSKTTVPTDAKHSKPSETQCLSKATSIDSWCSNDTLYNVEENFDDLAMDADIPEFEPEHDKSESSDTLTHNEEEKELSHCSTYIVHDSKSERCETFTPDSITANDNYTYTKAKTEAAGTTPSVNTVDTKSDVNDSEKNTQTKDLAYGTLPSYSNCTTELLSGFDSHWILPQPELVRRSPNFEDVTFTPPKSNEDIVKVHDDSPQLAERKMKKIDSVEIHCIEDNSGSENKTETEHVLIDVDDSPKYRTMTPSVTSTPLAEPGADNGNIEPMFLDLAETSDTPDKTTVPNFITFFQSAEIRPQDISPNMSNEQTTDTVGNTDTGLLLEAESKTLSRNSNRDNISVSDRTPTYSDFENSAAIKPQEINSRSSQSIESGMSSGDFRQFETSVRQRPQDLTSPIDASSLLLNSERKLSDLVTGFTNSNADQTGNELVEQSVVASPPIVSNIILTDLDDANDQPHSIIVTELLKEYKDSPNKTFDSHISYQLPVQSQSSAPVVEHMSPQKVNGLVSAEHVTEVPELESPVEETVKSLDALSPKQESAELLVNFLEAQPVNGHVDLSEVTNRSISPETPAKKAEVHCNGNSESYATVNFINENFEELIESNVDDDKDLKTKSDGQESNESIEQNNHESIEPSTDQSLDKSEPVTEEIQSPTTKSLTEELPQSELQKTIRNGSIDGGKMTSVTDNFLQNEKKFCQLDLYLPMLSDIRFTGPATEIMSTSFQDSPTEPNSPECERDGIPDPVADIVKDWDSDTDSQSSNSSSGEFIWKQRGSGSQSSGRAGGEQAAETGSASGSGESVSGSEGDEVEFVPSSWDCRAAPAKSSLRSLEQAPLEGKKRVVFKRQKYHCVYEYPREAPDHAPAPAPAFLPDLSTYCEWDPSSAEEAEMGYGQLFGGDYDEDFFISSSARPFESLGIMSTTSQFFPGMRLKPAALFERDLADDLAEFLPAPPSPLPTPTPTQPPLQTLLQTRTPSLDFTTPDSGVEDITPGSTEEDFKKKLSDPEVPQCWRAIDSGSSSESVSPSSPGGEALGGLRHTRDKLKLDLPPSPHIPSPRHNRVFNFVLDKPKRRATGETPPELGSTPLVMTDDTPVVTTALPLDKDCEELPVPEPTFSTFGKSCGKSSDQEQKMILTDDDQEQSEKVESPVKAVEAVKGEGTVLDSGDEDSGIESSSKATLERKTPNVS